MSGDRTDAITGLRVLPICVEPFPAETPESYFSRLCAANSVSTADMWLTMRRGVPGMPVGATPQYALPALEAISGLPEGYFGGRAVPPRVPPSTFPARGSQSAKGHVQARSTLCRRCAGGEAVMVARYVGPICTKYARWHDNGQDTDVSGHPAAMAAQRRFNGTLLLRGIAYRSAEGVAVRDLLRLWRMHHQPSGAATSSEIEDFALVARLICRLTSPEFLDVLTIITAGRQAHAAALEEAIAMTVLKSRQPLRTIEVRDREMILSGTPMRAIGQTIPLGSFAQTIRHRMPTIRARLLHHRNAV